MKQCTGCKETKALSEYGSIKGKKNAQCKKCATLRQAKYAAKNRERVRALARKYYHASKDRINKDRRAQRAKNKVLGTHICKETRTPEEHKAFLLYSNKYGKKHDVIGRATLNDRYIKKCIRQQMKLVDPNFTTKDITPELIEIKYKEITLKRKLNSTNYGNKN